MSEFTDESKPPADETVPFAERWADALARRFHEAYERLAPDHGYDTRPESAVPWEDVPEANRLLMRAVVKDLFDNQAVSSKDHEGFWFRHADQRGWPILTLRPEGHSGSFGERQ